MLDMKCAPKNGMLIAVFFSETDIAVVHWDWAQWRDDYSEPDHKAWVSGDISWEEGDADIRGWWPIGNKWLDPKVVPPPRNTCFAALVGTGVSMPAIARWDVNRNEWFDCNSGSAVTVLGWLPLPDESAERST